jgi:hypothetical protein
MPEGDQEEGVEDLTLETLDQLDGVVDDDQLDEDPGDELDTEVDEPLRPGNRTNPEEVEEGELA